MIPGMPDIPDFKGLVTSGTSAAISFGGAFAINRVFGNHWGVYNQFGVPILLADTVYSLQYNNVSQVAQAPLERGTFTSYNKVQNPYKATVTLIRGGASPAARGAFIGQLEALSRSTLLFHVVTPDYVHRNAAIIGFDYARESQAGARMIAANLHVEEIRETSLYYETIETANPEDSPVVQAGEQQLEQPRQSMLVRIVNSETGQSLLDMSQQAIDRFNGDSR